MSVLSEERKDAATIANLNALLPLCAAATGAPSTRRSDLPRTEAAQAAGRQIPPDFTPHMDAATPTGATRTARWPAPMIFNHHEPRLG